jgi:hypothetical protein
LRSFCWERTEKRKEKRRRREAFGAITAWELVNDGADVADTHAKKTLR